MRAARSWIDAVTAGDAAVGRSAVATTTGRVAGRVAGAGELAVTTAVTTVIATSAVPATIRARTVPRSAERRLLLIDGSLVKTWCGRPGAGGPMRDGRRAVDGR